jgi:hypothetical protein
MSRAGRPSGCSALRARSGTKRILHDVRLAYAVDVGALLPGAEEPTNAPVREVVIRLILAEIDFRGQYQSWLHHCADVRFPSRRRVDGSDTRHERSHAADRTCQSALGGANIAYGDGSFYIVEKEWR